MKDYKQNLILKLILCEEGLKILQHPIISIIIIVYSLALQPSAGYGLLIHEVS
jgi:hypothetical protein